MTAQTVLRSRWAALPVSLRAVVTGVLVALIAANVWPALLLSLGMPLAAGVELLFLGLYVWWVSGGGPPQSTHAARSVAFRSGALSTKQWFWGLVGAFSFAVTIHASIVFLFRLTPFPLEAFRQGYDFSFIPSQTLRWIAVVVSAISAGICEETGFRSYMQQLIEERHGAPTAIAAFAATAAASSIAPRRAFFISVFPQCRRIGHIGRPEGQPMFRAICSLVLKSTRER